MENYGNTDNQNHKNFEVEKNHSRDVIENKDNQESKDRLEDNENLEQENQKSMETQNKSLETLASLRLLDQKTSEDRSSEFMKNYYNYIKGSENYKIFPKIEVISKN